MGVWLSLSIGNSGSSDGSTYRIILCWNLKHPLLKWLFQFQLDDSKSIHEKRLFHQTSIEKWLFGAPGCYVLNLYMTNITPVAMTTSYVGLDHSSSGVHSSKYLDVPVEVRISGVFHLYIVIYKWGILGWNNPLILTFHFLGHPNIFSGGASTVEKSSKHLDLHQIHRRNQQEVLGPSKKQLKVYQPTHSRSSSKHWNHPAKLLKPSTTLCDPLLASKIWIHYWDVRLEVTNDSLVSWFTSYLRDLRPTYIGVKIHLLSTMDIPDWVRISEKRAGKKLQLLANKKQQGKNSLSETNVGLIRLARRKTTRRMTFFISWGHRYHLWRYDSLDV